MNLFHRIDDALAIVRVKGGVFKQAELYRRGDRLFVKHGSGFVRIEGRSGDVWGTTAPGVSVLELPTDNSYIKHEGSERWSRPVWRNG